MVQIKHVIAAATLAAKSCATSVVVPDAAHVASRLRYIWPADLRIPAALIEAERSSQAQVTAPAQLHMLTAPAQLHMLGLSGSGNSPSLDQAALERLTNKNGYYVRAKVVPKGIHIDPDRVIGSSDDLSGGVNGGNLLSQNAPSQSDLDSESTENISSSTIPFTLITTSQPTNIQPPPNPQNDSIPASGWIILSGAVAAPTVLLSALAIRVLKQHQLVQTQVLMSSYSLDENVSFSENDDDEEPLRFQLVRDDAEDWDLRSPSYVTMQNS